MHELRKVSEVLGVFNGTWKSWSAGSAKSILFLLLLAVSLCGITLIGCGKKGPPVPPVDKREPVKEQSLMNPSGEIDGKMLILISKHEIRNPKQSQMIKIRMT